MRHPSTQPPDMQESGVAGRRFIIPRRVSLIKMSKTARHGLLKCHEDSGEQWHPDFWEQLHPDSRKHRHPETRVQKNPEH